MKKEKAVFVSIESKGGKFIASVSVNDFLSMQKSPERILERAAKAYESSLTEMRSMIAEMRIQQGQHKLIPARLMWRLGDAVFRLRDKLKSFSLRLDGVYSHLTRDLGVKRKWLEKAIIFRRYLPRQTLIPRTLNWGRCEKGTRRVAERLRAHLPPT